MQRAWIRSSLFNIVFLIVNAICCVVLLPALLLPRHLYIQVIHGYHLVIYALEVFILGLRYEVRGKEHLPQNGSFLVAAKHQSTYETFKLRLLFDDPAIILKRELLRIPLWGAFLKKSDVIAIDRSTPEKATESIRSGALRMKEQGRPIIIFPQGTRVWPHETSTQKPYKSGVHRIQAATDLPIVPMATNAGMFWPRAGWLKSSGTVVFEFLPMIEAGKDKSEVMSHLEKEVEEHSLSLMNEAKMAALDKKFSPLKLLISLILLIGVLFGVYSYIWFEVAERLRVAYIDAVSEMGRSTFVQEPVIYGYPGRIHLDVIQQSFFTRAGTMDIKVIEVRGWPIPLVPVDVRTGPVTIKSLDWVYPVQFDTTHASLTFLNDVITINDSELKQGKFTASITGSIDLNQRPFLNLNLELAMENHTDFLSDLAGKKIIRPQIAMFLGAGFTALMDEDRIVRVPLIQREQTLYAGPLPVMQIPETFEPAAYQPVLPPLEPYNQLGPNQ